ncbi:MAG TPA: SbcC/MukB-like Walker B domain-containing protein [Rhizomicrobium sp.]
MSLPQLFILRNITAVNFYLYGQDFPISGRGNTVFLGGNGSGKSVLLDAIQIVMTGLNKRYLDLNSRVSEGGRSTRTVREACLGLLDDGNGFERQACITYLALGFESEDGKRLCTAGVCLEAKVSLSDENVLGLFIIEDHILRFEDFVNPRGKGYEEKAWQSFLDEQRRKGHEFETYPRQNNRGFLRHLYSLVNGNARGTQLDPDRARAAMRQALSFDIAQITSVTDFVKRFLLDDLPIEIETFQARYNTWRSMQKDIARIEAEIGTVETIRASTIRVMEDQFQARVWAYGASRAEYDRFRTTIEQQRTELTRLQEQLDSIESYQQTLADNIEYARGRLESVNRQIAGIAAYDQVRDARNALDVQDARRKAAVAQAKPIFDGLNALREVTRSPQFPSGQFAELRSLSERQLATIGTYHAGWPKDGKAITTVLSAVPPLSPVRAYFEQLYQDATTQRARLGQELTEVERRLKPLQTGGTLMSPDTQDFLADMARMQISAKSLSEVADIDTAHGNWRGIVEAVLGDWCDAVIVEPGYMDRAYAHFDQNYKRTRAKLVQTENTSRQDGEIGRNTLAEVVRTENRYARAFLNVRLGRIVRARSADDIRKGDVAASADGKFAHGRGIEYRRLDSIPKLGKSMRGEQIAQLTEKQTELTNQLQTARERETRLHALSQALRQASSTLIDDRVDNLAVLDRLDTADRESRRLVDLVAELETDIPSDLLDEKTRCESDLKAYLQEQREEKTKELELTDKRAGLRKANEMNLESRRKAGQQALDAIPPLERRLSRHTPSVGLEHFVRRARVAYRLECGAHQHMAQVRNHYETLIKDKRSLQRVAVNRLVTAIQDYVQNDPEQHPGFDWANELEGERTVLLYDWISLRHRHLTETVLRGFKVQVDKAVAALVETMVHDFLSRLSANIDAVDRTKEDLNRALRGSVFMSEVYQIRQERDPDKETIRYLIDRIDIIAPKATALMQAETDASDPDQVKIKELIEMLTLESADDAATRRRLRELADYRSYFRFSIDICDPNQSFRKISDLEQRRGKASGGQKFVPFYICLGVAASAAYHNHLGGSQDAPPQSALLLMDEAFEKLDPDNIYKVIQFYQKLGLQLVMAAPKTHQALYQETFDTLISIIRRGRAIQATAQHFHAPARALLLAENPMHKPKTFFEERVKRGREDAAE